MLYDVLHIGSNVTFATTQLRGLLIRHQASLRPSLLCVGKTNMFWRAPGIFVLVYTNCYVQVLLYMQYRRGRYVFGELLEFRLCVYELFCTSFVIHAILPVLGTPVGP